MTADEKKQELYEVHAGALKECLHCDKAGVFTGKKVGRQLKHECSNKTGCHHLVGKVAYIQGHFRQS